MAPSSIRINLSCQELVLEKSGKNPAPLPRLQRESGCRL